MVKTTYNVEKAKLNNIVFHAVQMGYPLRKLESMNDKFTTSSSHISACCKSLGGKVKQLAESGDLKDKDRRDFEEIISKLLKQIEDMRLYIHKDYHKSRDIALEHQAKLLGHVKGIEGYEYVAAEAKARKDVDSLVHAYLKGDKNTLDGSFTSGDKLL